MSFSTGVANSFVTFQPLTYVTDNGCVNEPLFCYPIRFNSDLAFQINVPMPSQIPQDPALDMIFKTISNGVETVVDDVVVVGAVTSDGSYGLFFDF